MHAVILAAGEGRRLGSHTDDVPKAFLEIGGRTLYDRQRETVAEHVDDVTIVVGYRRDRVVGELGRANAVVFDSWHDYENAESLRRALRTIDDDVLVVNGDVVLTDAVVDGLCRRFEAADREWNLVGCLPGVQDDHTAIRTDDRGVVIDYGEIPGRRHAGVGILRREDGPAAERVLERNATEWYPVVYPRLPTRAVELPPADHLEINTPADLERAKRRLPLASAPVPRFENE